MDRKTEDRVVATSEAAKAPEYRMRVVQHREFTSEFATTRVTLELPFGQRVELSESRQLEVLLGLIESALPEVRRAEDDLERGWRRWRVAAGEAREASALLRPAERAD